MKQTEQFPIKHKISQAIQEDDVSQLHGLSGDEIKSQQSFKFANLYSMNAIHFAAVKNATQCLKYLVEQLGVNVDLPLAPSNLQPLHIAAQLNNIDAMKYLIGKGADINAKNKYANTPLHTATLFGKIEAIKCLIENGADINAQNKNGNPPLHAFIKLGETHCKQWDIISDNVIECLIENGADINAQNKDGNPPMHAAAFYNNINAIKCLSNNGADINAQNKDGDTPLHVITTFNIKYENNTFMPTLDTIRVIECLSNNGADINAKNKYSNTPLHNAVKSNKIYATKCLIKNGADIEAQNLENKTPIELAKNPKNKELVKWFKIGEVLKKVCALQTLQEDQDLYKLFTESDKLETYTKEFMKCYLVKNGIADDYLEKFKESIKVLPKNIAGDMQTCLEQLISASSRQLQVLEGQLRMFIEGTSNIPYDLLESSKGQLFLNKSEYSLREFYKTHPEFKDAGNYLLYVLGFESQIENLPCLNYIMLINEDISLLVKDLYNKLLIPSALKEGLREVINQHTVFYSQKDELFNLIDLQQLYEELAVEQEDENNVLSAGNSISSYSITQITLNFMGAVSEIIAISGEFLRQLNDDEDNELQIDNNEVDIAGRTDSLD